MAPKLTIKRLPMRTGLPFDQDALWSKLHAETVALAAGEPFLASFLHATVINHRSMVDSLSYLLAGKLVSANLPSLGFSEIAAHVFASSPETRVAICRDLAASSQRDPASRGIANPFLNQKGFHALAAYRIGHFLWEERRYALALFLQNRISEVFAVDIHPAALLGTGVFIDHGTGVVIGETAVVGDNVSMLQGVTLGGTGKETGDRHPKVQRGVLIGAGATILGNIQIGTGAKVGAGSVVLHDVPPHTTVAGVPAKVVGHPASSEPGLSMDQSIDDNSG
jgi:serine O-acetyltransferase